MHDQWYLASEYIPDGLYLIEVVHSKKLITFTPERSTLVQQDRNPQVRYFFLNYINRMNF
jgi:hypothetical protein